MRIKLTSIMVDDQDRALKFYTDVLGFEKKFDFPVGEYRWITVVSPEGPDDLQLALEPNANPAGKTFQEAMFKQGIPLAAFEVSDIGRECARLRDRGVAFTREPTRSGPVTIAVFADTCGNLIQLYQPETAWRPATLADQLAVGGARVVCPGPGPAPDEGRRDRAQLHSSDQFLDGRRFGCSVRISSAASRILSRL